MFQDLFLRQKAFFGSGRTRDIDFRKQNLRGLKAAIKAHESALLKALYQDLRKSDIDAFTSEIGFVLNEIDYSLRYLKNGQSPKSAKPSGWTYRVKALSTLNPRVWFS